VPRDEAPLVERWDEAALWYSYCDQRADRFTVDKALVPGSTHVWGDLEWRALAAPGHDMAALVFHNPEHGILVSGDALWENGFGVVMPPDVDAAAIPATRATIEMIAGLGIGVVIPGHGEPFTDVAAALERARGRIAAFEADRVRVARHALKVMLVFTLLDRRRLALAELPSYVDRIGLYRDFNRLYFRLPPSEFAAMLVAELEKARAVRREDGWLVPA
jgi:glyoxylase-like metal-dependent hydrolase (beta-lactamase superfamily II)